ncbi:MAG: DUF2851 family protein [Bacteroidales bacterium]|nr:DUF2851 family protein [Bacteroidales bacterium]
MKENVLHYLFENKLITNSEFEIISPGTINLNAGPDFFNAKIKIGNTIWAGNVEIHMKASDWYVHQHQNDPAYDNIILHLVLDNDKAVFNSKGSSILTYQIKYKQEVLEQYSKWEHTLNNIPCSDTILKLDTFNKNNFTEALAFERIEQKSKDFEQLIFYNQNNIEEAFFQALAMGFGGHLNKIPFELLAKNTPLNTILKQKDSWMQIEAILFGQSGLLNPEVGHFNDDEYLNSLMNEYRFLSSKYRYKGIRAELWKFSKIRPYNFPSVKLALFASLIYHQHNIFSKVLNLSSLKDLSKIFQVEASDYWRNHYRPGKTSKQSVKRISESTFHYLVINILVPFLYIYSQQTRQENIKARVLNWLEEMPAENNRITRIYEDYGFENMNALFSQGLIELNQKYCEQKQCLSCRLGHQMLKIVWNEH